ncbi:hypothetical protein ON010_g17024 [Phytophthora cinnamomi]|nr:hypothetical protein ON010_g17024 [Phytophthora cinnamomi]
MHLSAPTDPIRVHNPAKVHPIPAHARSVVKTAATLMLEKSTARISAPGITAADTTNEVANWVGQAETSTADQTAVAAEITLLLLMLRQRSMNQPHSSPPRGSKQSSATARSRISSMSSDSGEDKELRGGSDDNDRTPFKRKRGGLEAGIAATLDGDY